MRRKQKEMGENSRKKTHFSNATNESFRVRSGVIRKEMVKIYQCIMNNNAMYMS